MKTNIQGRHWDLESKDPVSDGEWKDDSVATSCSIHGGSKLHFEGKPTEENPRDQIFLREKSYVRGYFLPVAPWLLTVNPRELPYDNPSLTSPAGGIEWVGLKALAKNSSLILFLVPANTMNVIRTHFLEA